MSNLLGIFTVLVQFILTDGVLTVSPSNVTVKVGNPATFQCTPVSTVGMVWNRYEPKVRVFYSNRPNPISDSVKYSYNVTNNNYLFTVVNPQLTDGAPYSCDDTYDLEETFANLLVVATPVVSLTPASGLTAGQNVNISCVVDYGGATKDDIICPLSPDQELKLSIAIGSDTAYVQGGQGVLYYDYKTTADGVQPVTRRRSLSVNMTLANRHAGQYVICNVSSTKPYYSDYARVVVPITAAPNVLTMNATNTTNYRAGTYINCTANGYPIPTVTWKAVTPSGCGNSFQGQANTGYAVINVSCSGPNTWNCSASNTNGQIWQPINFIGIGGSTVGNNDQTVKDTGGDTTTQVPTNPPSTQPTNCPTVAQACNFIKLNNNGAPSGEYRIGTLFGRTIQVFCEMGLNGGGYTFIKPFDWPSLSNAELQAMFQDRTSLLVRARKTDGTQPYGILKQLPAYSNSALNVGLNTNAPYTDPVNYASMGQPFMSFGFHPLNTPAINNIQGVRCNGVNITFNNCPSVSNSYVALFADFNESPEVTTSTTNVDFINQILTNLTSNPSGRVMPAEYFTFAEFQFGQGTCAHYTTTGRLRSTIGVLSVAIGIR